MGNIKFSIILPYYNHWDLTHASLMSLYRNCFYYHQEDMEIILVDDASPEMDCQTGVTFWQKIYNKTIPILRYHRSDVNYGFGGSMNYGAKMAKGDILVLLSNDVLFKIDILALVDKQLGDTPDALVSGELINYPAGWNEFEFSGKKVFIPYCNGWLLACRKEVWERIGGFDVLTFGKFDVEDVDLSTRAAELGYNLVALNNPALKHIGGATIYNLGIDRMAHTKVNREKYIAKWGTKLLEIGKRY